MGANNINTSFFKKERNLFVLLGAVLLSIVLFSLALPGIIEIPIFAWVAFVPLFLLWHEILPRNAIVAGFLWGVLLILTNAWWLGYRDIKFVLLLALFTAILSATAFYIITKFRSRSSQFWFIIDCAMLVVLYEWFVKEGIFSAAYFTISESQYQMIFFSVLAGVLGKFGLSFLIILAGGVIFFILRDRNKVSLPVQYLGFGILAVLLIASGLSIGMKVFNQQNKIQGDTKTVLVIQSDPIHYYNPDNPNDIKGTARLVDITVRALKENKNKQIDLVVWPNSAIAHMVFRIESVGQDELYLDSPGATLTMASLRELVQQHNVSLLFGTFIRIGGAFSLRHTNAMILLLPDGSIQWQGKQWPVFGQEYMPNFIRPILQKVLPGAGDEPRMPVRAPFRFSEDESFVAPICSENGNLSTFVGGRSGDTSYIIHPHHYVDYRSMDVFKKNAALDQMLASISSKYVLSVGSSGFTALFSPEGSTQLLLPSYKEGSALLSLPIRRNTNRIYFWGQVTTKIIIILLFVVFILKKLTYLPAWIIKPKIRQIF